MEDPRAELWQFVAAAGAWLTGEAGRVAVAGAAGGLVRWFHQERRRLIDGVLSVAGGFFAAVYMPPLIVAFLRVWGVDLAPGAAVSPSIGFVTGLIGMSFAKFLIAFFEVQMGRALRDPDQKRGDDYDA